MPGSPQTEPSLLRSVLTRTRRVVQKIAPPRPSQPPARPLPEAASDAEFVRLIYVQMLGREPDADGAAHHLAAMRKGLSRAQLADILANSAERQGMLEAQIAIKAFHGGRVDWIRSLPPARRILDLGGTALGDDRGALVVMGYPHEFDEIVIIELPPEARHDLYKIPPNRSIQADTGAVTYMYRSMTDLADLPDQSFDMVCSAQTFEHIQPDEGRHVLQETRRLLKPGGYLALDTPNGPVSGIQAREAGNDFINPDHKIEYSHQQMLDLFAETGFVVHRQQGIGFMPKTVATGKFVLNELVEYPSLYDDIERCYTLAYLVQPA